jgi:hypothetical protein
VTVSLEVILAISTVLQCFFTTSHMTRLRGGLNCVLEPLYHCAFNLHQLDMCQVVAPQKAMKDFFEANKKSIRGPFSGVPAGPVHTRIPMLRAKRSPSYLQTQHDPTPRDVLHYLMPCMYPPSLSGRHRLRPAIAEYSTVPLSNNKCFPFSLSKNYNT